MIDFTRIPLHNDLNFISVNYKIIDLSRYVDEVYSFEQVQDAYVSATAGGKYRVVISLVSNE